MFETRKIDGINVREWDSVGMVEGLLQNVKLVAAAGPVESRLETAADVLRAEGYDVSVSRFAVGAYILSGKKALKAEADAAT
jgi:hypothetical protein